MHFQGNIGLRGSDLSLNIKTMTLMRFPINVDAGDLKMKKRYSEEQIIRAIKQHESGTKVDDICRDMGY